jgi:hypothetical protein
VQAPSPRVKCETPPSAASLEQPRTPTQVHSPPQSPPCRYIPRTDTRFNPRTRLLSVQLELPGVQREDLSVVLSTCYWNGVRQILVRGRVCEPWVVDAEPWDAGDGSGDGEAKCVSAPSGVPEGECTIIRERKYGEFGRAVAVPPETTVRSFLVSCFVVSSYLPCSSIVSILGWRCESAARGRSLIRACQV